jgi:FAD/FMN-containing dehydrogenase
LGLSKRIRFEERKRSFFVLISRQDLADRLHGERVTPGDPTYEDARKVFNGRIDKHPAMIVYCTSVSDVILAVQFAQSEQLAIAVRSGGHSIAGHGVCDDGVVIDLSRMKDIQVDVVHCTCRAQAGLTLSEFVKATQVYDLATTTGVGTSTGLAGLTVGGGLGWLMGTYGLTIDSLLSAEIVTATGEMLHTSATEHPDLFWAIRGGGGNFGIITTFEFQLHKVGQVLAGMVVHPLSQLRELLHFYREYTRGCPDELTVYVVCLKLPDGNALANFVACYHGPLDVGERHLAPLRAFHTPLADLIRPMSIVEANALINPSPTTTNWANYQGGHSVAALSDEVIETLANAITNCPSPFALVVLEHQHGAACRVAPEATAYALRQEHYILLATASWPHGEGIPYIEWVRQFQMTMKPFALHGTYINYLEDEGEEHIQASYGANYERLVQVKRRYDPTNAFHVNQNIKPAL